MSTPIGIYVSIYINTVTLITLLILGLSHSVAQLEHKTKLQESSQGRTASYSYGFLLRHTPDKPDKTSGDEGFESGEDSPNAVVRTHAHMP